MITPLEMKNASSTSQTRSVPVDFTTSSKVITPVSAPAVAPMMATADIGSGAVMMPAIVATKIANMCQALGGKPAGGGMNHSTRPMATGMRNFQRVPFRGFAAATATLA